MELGKCGCGCPEDKESYKSTFSHELLFFFYFSLFKKIVLKARFYETLKDYINLFPTLTYQEVDLEFWVLEISRKAVFDGVKRMPRTDGLLLQVILSTVSSGAAI